MSQVGCIVESDVCRALPLVSLVIPMLNEARYIEPCIHSLRLSDYPADRLEILVVDGGSDDASRSIVLAIAKKDQRVKLLDNPFGVSAAAINIGVAHAVGEIIVRIDAHATYADDYVLKSVKALLGSPDVGSVAGVQHAEGVGFWQSVIAAAMSHPFASGFAKYRRANRAVVTDTVFLGAWRRSDFLFLGGFDPSWRVNGDYEFNIRIRLAGLRILLSPDIRSTYFPRESLPELVRQYFRYGFWRVKTTVAYPREAKVRQFVAPGLILGLLASCIAAPWTWWPVSLLGIAYGALSLASSLQTAYDSGWRYLWALPFAFAAMQLPWGIGFLVGLFCWVPQARKLQLRKIDSVKQRSWLA